MPVFDWTRTELARMRPDGSTVLAYNQAAVDAIDPAKMFESIAGDMNGTVMPGWEPERMAHVKELFEMYKDVDDEKLFANLKYFLERIMPTCDKYNINMAIHSLFRGPVRTPAVSLVRSLYFSTTLPAALFNILAIVS